MQPLPSPFVMGLLNQPATIHIQGNVEILAVRCFPWTVVDLLGLPSGKSNVALHAHPVAQLQSALEQCIHAGQIDAALAHCSVLILEKAQTLQSPLKRLPFGMRGLSSPTIAALSRRGLLDELEMPKRLKNPHSYAVSGPRRQAGHFAGIPFYDGDIDSAQWTCRLPGATDTSLIAELEELDTVLERRALALGVTIKRGRVVSDVQQSDDSVIVWSDAERFHGRWLVGCDGSRSVVRKLGGVEFAGTEPEFTGYSTLVEIANPELLKAGRNVTSRGMYMQSQPGYVVIQDFDGGAFHQSDLPITLEHLQQVLRRVSDTDVTLTALHSATSWTDRARQATSYRIGRVLLAGDAAHIHSPLGGQGLNLGLGDAMNLGWKLAATIHGTAPHDVVDEPALRLAAARWLNYSPATQS